MPKPRIYTGISKDLGYSILKNNQYKLFGKIEVFAKKRKDEPFVIVHRNDFKEDDKTGKIKSEFTHFAVRN